MPCATVLCGPSADATSRDRLAAALLRPGSAVEMAGDRLVGGRVLAPLVGGTLASLSAMVGTPDCMPASGAIAVLEDLGETPYRVERFLTLPFGHGPVQSSLWLGRPAVLDGDTGRLLQAV